MAIDTRTLTKLWIQFLKNTQVVSTTSGKGGKLDYKRPVSVADLTRFLEVKTDFDRADIMAALQQVLAKTPTAPSQAPDRRIQRDQTSLPSPSNANTPKLPSGQPKLGAPVQRKPGKYDNKDASDIDYREVSEAIRDQPGPELSEPNIEAIFDILVSGAKSQKKQRGAKSQATDNNDNADTPAGQSALPAPAVDTSDEEIRKLKSVIRDTMTPQQRKSLWRALLDE